MGEQQAWKRALGVRTRLCIGMGAGTSARVMGMSLRGLLAVGHVSVRLSLMHGHLFGSSFFLLALGRSR